MYYAQILGDVADKTSALERRAEEVERETIKLKKAEYMETRLGQNYEGIISGVTGWGCMWNCRIRWKVWCISVH